MPDKRPKYHEHLLHWIWASRHLDITRLQTSEGLPLTLYNPGYHNQSDGPDFINAELQIGSLKWFGDVEIHWREQDWNQHHHDTDPNFNRVVLHVVYQKDNDSGNPVLRQDGSQMHTLFLKPYVAEPLQSFLDRFNRPDTLPCAGHFSYISEEAFKRQLDKAHKAYFEQKIDDLFHFYESSLPPSRAWVGMLATGLFDGLGIAHNRKPMRKLCGKLLRVLPDVHNRNEFINRAVSIARMQDVPASRNFGWKHKNSRPANHPKTRIRQAAECLWYIHQVPFGQWLEADYENQWKILVNQIQTHPGLGKERSGIMYGTVWLPAFFILGNLFNSKPLRTSAYNDWLNHQPKLPSSLTDIFASLDVSPETYRENPGSIYQLRSFCRPRNCQQCEVFKSVISS